MAARELTYLVTHLLLLRSTLPFSVRPVSQFVTRVTATFPKERENVTNAKWSNVSYDKSNTDINIIDLSFCLLRYFNDNLMKCEAEVSFSTYII